MENISTPVNQVGIGAPPQALILTEKAIGKIKEFAEKMPESKGKMFRVFVEGGGCSGFQYGFNFDDERPGDEVVHIGEVSVLLDASSRPYLLGSVVDYVEDFKGAGFNVKNPNAKASCGCGTSFTV